MKNQLLILAFVATVAVAGVGASTETCECTQCTCDWDPCANQQQQQQLPASASPPKPQRPTPAPPTTSTTPAITPMKCKTARGKVSPYIYEESDGAFVYSMQIDARIPWTASLQRCLEQDFTHLVTIDTETKRQFIDAMQTKSGFRGVNTYGAQFWTSYNNRNDTGWQWEPSGSTYFDQANWWEAGQPNGAGACGSITNKTKFNDGSCQSGVFRICQAPVCPP